MDNCPWVERFSMSYHRQLSIVGNVGHGGRAGKAGHAGHGGHAGHAGWVFMGLFVFCYLCTYVFAKNKSI